MSDRTPHPHEPPPRDERRTGGPGHGTDRPRRSRVRRLLPLAAAVWVVLEIWLLLLVADAVGGFIVLGLLVGAFALGALAIKQLGGRAWKRLAATLQSETRGGGGGGQEEARSAGGNALAMALLGGLLLMIPGLVSDAVGLLCLFPPTAALLRRGAERLLARGELGEAVQQTRSTQRQERMRHGDGKIVQGEVVRDDEPPAR